jgi:hypothetical protein
MCGYWGVTGTAMPEPNVLESRITVVKRILQVRRIPKRSGEHHCSKRRHGNQGLYVIQGRCSRGVEVARKIQRKYMDAGPANARYRGQKFFITTSDVQGPDVDNQM